MSLLTQEFEKIMRDFEETEWFWGETPSRVEQIMRGEVAQIDYEKALESEIQRMKTVAGLQRLRKNYERVSRKKLNKKHPLYTLYQERMKQIIETL